MQAQVKDEVQEAEPLDSASQKSVTDWLMHVISGKQQEEEHLRTPAQGAPKMEPLINMTAPVVPKVMNGHGAAETNGSTPEAWTGLFTAEDLCGAPVIPLPLPVEESKDAITADDVCWVPEDRRLKPEPLIITRSAAVVQPQGQMASVFDISREPAPHFAHETAGQTFAPEEKEITAADISRQWVIDEMEQTTAPEPTPEPIAEPIPLPDYSAQIASVPAPEVIAEPEPVANFASDPFAVVEPKSVPNFASDPFAVVEREPVAAFAPEPVAAVEPEPIAAIAPEPAVAPEPIVAAEPTVANDPFAFAAGLFAEKPAPAPVIETPATKVAPEPQIDVAPVAYAEPVEYAYADPDPEPVVSQAKVIDAEQTTTMRGEAMPEPEIVHESGTYADHYEEPAVAEPVARTDEKVWAKEGYWEGVRRGVHDSEQRILEGKIGEGNITDAKAAEGKIAGGEVEKGLGKPQAPADHGYFGSYLGPDEVEEIEKAKPDGWSQSWRTLIRLGSALPWLSRALPALEAGMGGQVGPPAAPQGGAAPGASAEMQQDVAGMRLVQYEIRTTVQDHAAHLKRMEEQLTRVRESVESKAAQKELTENVQSAMKMVKLVGIGLGGLLVLLIVLAVMMIMRH